MNKWDILSNLIILYDINAIQTNIINILPTSKEIILTIWCELGFRDMRQGYFFNLTGDMGLKIVSDTGLFLISDRGQGLFFF